MVTYFGGGNNMATNVESQINGISKTMGDLAEVVRDLVTHVYQKDGMYAEEEEYEVAGDPNGMMPGEDPMMERGGMDAGMPPTDPMMDPGMGAGMPGEEMPGMMPEEMPEEMEMEVGAGGGGGLAGGGSMQCSMGHYHKNYAKGSLAAQRRKSSALANQRRKGYNNTALQTTNEEDAPFDEQQDSIDGNQPSPAGKMTGERDDETFNMNFQSLSQDLAELKQIMSGGQTAKAVVPGLGKISKGRDGNVVTDRNFQEVIKTRSFREINALREQVGDLPRNLIA